MTAGRARAAPPLQSGFGEIVTGVGFRRGLSGILGRAGGDKRAGDRGVAPRSCVPFRRIMRRAPRMHNRTPRPRERRGVITSGLPGAACGWAGVVFGAGCGARCAGYGVRCWGVGGVAGMIRAQRAA